MTYAKFMLILTEYYGEYFSEFCENMVSKYIREKFREDELENVQKTLFKKHSNKFRTDKRGNPPDIALFEEIFGNDEGDLESEALTFWRDINKKIHSYYDIFFEDIRLQAVIIGMGGWVAFCQRPNDQESEVWAFKRFIELYKLFTKTPPMITHEKLRGLSDCGMKKEPPCIFFGNEEACKKILDKESKQIPFTDYIASASKQMLRSIDA